MAFLPSMSSSDIHDYHQVVTRSMNMRSHFDLLIWLQGDMQRYFPHHIMVAAWGNFDEGAIQYDVLSPLAGVRSHTTNPLTVVPMLQRLFLRWSEFGNKPFSMAVGTDGFISEDETLKCGLRSALCNMRSAMVHGIKDARGSHDCLYVAFSTRTRDATENESGAMAMVLPYVDIALRQVAHLPLQAFPVAPMEQAETADTALAQHSGLTDREAEIVNWVGLGKTNADIGMILGISEFTVKNHMQRIFKKLDVSNRAQAVSKLNTFLADV